MIHGAAVITSSLFLGLGIGDCDFETCHCCWQNGAQSSVHWQHVRVENVPAMSLDGSNNRNGTHEHALFSSQRDSCARRHHDHEARRLGRICQFARPFHDGTRSPGRVHLFDEGVYRGRPFRLLFCPLQAHRLSFHRHRYIA